MDLINYLEEELREIILSLISSLIQPVGDILDKVIPDQDLKRKLSHEIATMSEKHAQQALLAQLEINKAEAASGSLFKGGWRPAVGWVCAIAFMYHFILKDLSKLAPKKSPDASPVITRILIINIP